MDKSAVKQLSDGMVFYQVHVLPFDTIWKNPVQFILKISRYDILYGAGLQPKINNQEPSLHIQMEQ